mmetsp:Transcript_26999/g.81728  ORF Transcript_26999/g.81728 Transcript_26999/m.81728 type:complete len:324 (-) Transcript_26999:1320-2291(-)
MSSGASASLRRCRSECASSYVVRQAFRVSDATWARRCAAIVASAWKALCCSIAELTSMGRKTRYLASPSRDDSAACPLSNGSSPRSLPPPCTGGVIVDLTASSRLPAVILEGTRLKVCVPCSPGTLVVNAGRSGAQASSPIMLSSITSTSALHTIKKVSGAAVDSCSITSGSPSTVISSRHICGRPLGNSGKPSSSIVSSSASWSSKKDAKLAVQRSSRHLFCARTTRTSWPLHKRLRASCTELASSRSMNRVSTSKIRNTAFISPWTLRCALGFAPSSRSNATAVAASNIFSSSVRRIRVSAPLMSRMPESDGTALPLARCC